MGIHGVHGGRVAAHGARRSLLSALALVALVGAAACSSESEGATDAAGGSEDDPTEETTTTAPSRDDDWEQVVAPSSCMCSDGSEFRFSLNRADPTKVVFYLQGGGACFSAATCSESGATYRRNLSDEKGPDPEGIFDFDNEENPFADHSFVYVPYCTGDVHLGNTTYDYGDGVVIEHRGYLNASTALTAAAATFPDAEQVVVVGASAGSAGAPLYGGLAHDVFPDAQITVLADSSGAYPGDEGITAAIGTLWGTTNAVPRWDVNEGMTAGRWSLPGLFVQAGKHDPDIVLARHDYAFDQTQVGFAALVGVPADDLVSLIDRNEQVVEDGGVDLHTWVQAGDEHTVVGEPEFYTNEVDGISLRDWVADLIAGKAVPDVHCDDCRTTS